MLDRARAATALSVVAAILLSGAPASAQHDTGHGDQGTPRPMNHLRNETSPYLLQHVHNPVDWYPWGEAALARAKELDRPIFLSIGYSACHWCHVMERESFMNEAIAKTLNENFVCIKVDREERPDLDEIYMTAVQAMTGRGGWPMSVFMTPSLEPFMGGTYWPPTDQGRTPGFDRVLKHTLKLWTADREAIEARAMALSKLITEHLAPEADPADPTLLMADMFAGQSAEHFDAEYGGFGHEPHFAPKFPHASELSALLRVYARTGDAAQLEIVTTTLDTMAKGGIYDQIGGGFHRYSTDREWLVPHFEKMLYDNALLTQTYVEAWRVTGDPLYERIARETLDYLLREMQDPAGGFWSTTDADSEGVEGKFFVWSKAEFDAVCGADAEIAARRYGVREGGNWEGHSILVAAESPTEIAAALELEPAAVEAAIARARAALYAARKQRIPPGTDDKVLATWNGMAVSALAAGYRAFGDERYLEAARRAATFVLTELRAPSDDGRLLRTWRKGEAKLQGYLEDHAYVAVGLLDLFECDFDPRWLDASKELLNATMVQFHDAADGAFWFTADDHEKLITRAKSVYESATPSGTSLAAQAFLRAGLLLADETLWSVGADAVRAHHTTLSERPIACPSLVSVVELLLGEPREVVVVGDGPAAAEFVERSRASFPPHHVLIRITAANRAQLEALTPVAVGKTAVDGAAAAYVCTRGTCEAPITDPAALRLR